MSDQETDTRPGHSTGPRSSGGKENSSRNAATHGLSCKKFFLIPGETEEDYAAHAQRWFNEYKEYSTPVLDSLIEDLIEAHWLQKRAARRILESESALANAEANRDPSADEIFKRLRNIQRYKTSYENSFQRALRAVESYRKSRLAELISHSRHEHIQHSTAAVGLKSLESMVKICQIPPERALDEMRLYFKAWSRFPQTAHPPS